MIQQDGTTIRLKLEDKTSKLTPSQNTKIRNGIYK